MMTSSLWRALEQLGAEGAAACDWRRHLGDDWEICRAFLKPVPGHAETVLDPERPARRLDVVTDGEDRFLGIVADDAPDGPPLPLSAADVAPLTLDWQTVADALGKTLGFTANRYESQGLTRQIGTAQNGSDPVRPVILCLPAGHFGDNGRMLRDISARHDATILLPSASWVTPPIQTLASASRLTLVAVAESLAEIAAIASVPALATPPAVKGSKKRKKPLFRIQPGWRWDMLTIEVAAGGRIIVSCDGQRKEHRFRKSNSRTHAKDYEILMHIASKSKWCNPPTGTPRNEAVRRQFYRFRETLNELIGIPGESFDMEGDNWKSNFKVRIHKDLIEFRNVIEADEKPDVFEDWHPMFRANSTME
jgi:hypothetical protein